MNRLFLVAMSAALCGCAARVPRIPGPLSPVGRAEVSAAVADAGMVVDEETASKQRGVSSRGSDAVARAAEFYLNHRPSGFRDDCSGFVCAAYHRAGIPLSGNSRSLWDGARQAGTTHHRKRPRVGDIAFFDQTYDRNRNGRLDDELTHVAIVLSVDASGTILMAHGGTSRGRTTLRMNLDRPHDRVDEEGAILNDYLRAKRSGDARSTRYLAAELWRGFAAMERDDLQTAAAEGGSRIDGIASTMGGKPTTP